MEQQEVFFESPDILRISTDNAVQIARIILTFNQNKFKQNPSLNIPLLLGRLSAALHRYTTTPTPRRPDAQWIRECEQDLQCLIGLTQMVMASLTLSARQNVTTLFSLSSTRKSFPPLRFGAKGIPIRYKSKKKKACMENEVSCS
jgi:hypothetical protein